MQSERAGLEATRILVVDDDPIERDLLTGLLEPQGYIVEQAADGLQAIDFAENSSPHCILLDILMPGVDGIETCRRLKNHSKTAAIPIIVISAVTDRDSRLAAIAAGADDFLGKPFDPDEVVLRVKNSVRMKQLYDRVQTDLITLERLELTRDSLTHMLVHDLRQPLTGIKAYTEHLVSKLTQQDNDDLATIARKVADLVESEQAMISLILDVTRLEEGKMPLDLSDFDLVEIAKESIELIGGQSIDCRIAFSPPENPLVVRCDRGILSRIIQNLLSNAIKFSPKSELVELAIEVTQRTLQLSVRDKGPGIPPEYHELVFEKFGQVKMGSDRRKYSSGLGLTFCKLAVEAHGGTISIDSVPGSGSTFCIELPLQ